MLATPSPGAPETAKALVKIIGLLMLLGIFVAMISELATSGVSESAWHLIIAQLAVTQGTDAATSIIDHLSGEWKKQSH